MNSQKIIISLVAVIIFLLGIILGQLLPPKNQLTQPANTNFSPNPGQNLGGPGPGGMPFNPGNNAGTTPPPPQDKRNIVQQENQEDAASLTSNEYWITQKITDDTKIAHGLWSPLQLKKPFLLEACPPPKYTVTNGAPEPIEFDRCKPAIQGKILALDKNKIVVSRAGSDTPFEIKYELENPKSKEPLLKINYEGQWIKLIPGSKNTLLQKLKELPSVKKDEELWLKKSLGQ